MTATVAALWRYPVKGIGAEPLQRTDLTPDRPLPGDRAWAVREAGVARAHGWQSCRAFMRGAKAPSLMAVMARSDGDILHLTHPDLPPLTFDPAADPQALLDWVRPIWPLDRPDPSALDRSPPQGMADVDFPSVSIMGTATLAALSNTAGQTLDPRRFRANVWLDGLAAWAEFDLVGRRFALGDAVLEGVERTGRCRATEANPETGRRDVDTLALLRDGWGHTQVGITARVTRGGALAVGDAAVLGPGFA